MKVNYSNIPALNSSTVFLNNSVSHVKNAQLYLTFFQILRIFDLVNRTKHSISLKLDRQFKRKIRKNAHCVIVLPQYVIIVGMH